MKTPKFDLIKKLCKDLESEKGVQILFAVENGSRAWRMESTNSDYDVRFVYYRPLEEYIDLKQKRDVIERMDGDVDLVGFDIFKFLKLLSKSNPTAIEWLVSDIVYCGKQNAAFKRFAKNEFNPISLYYHYKSLCRHNYEKYIKGGKKVSLKKYLYVYRGLVNAIFLIENKSLPLIDFNKTINAIVLPITVKNELTKIIADKRKGVELGLTKRIKVLDAFAEEFLTTGHEVSMRKPNVDVLNSELKKILIKNKN